MTNWASRIRQAFGPIAPEDDVIEELAQHAAAAYAAARAEGAADHEAALRVDQEIQAWVADPAALRRRPRRQPAVIPPSASRSMFAAAVGDARYAGRLMLRQPGYSALVVITMALGIAAATVLGSVAYGVLMKPLPWADAPRLVRLYESREGSTRRFRPVMTNGAFLAWRDHTPETLDALHAFTTGRSTLTGLGEPTQIRVGQLTPGLIEMLGAAPAIGRAFAPGEEQPGRPPIAVLSHGAWRQLFGSRSDIVGQTIRLDGQAHAIVGVMPATFQFPDTDTRVWTPYYIRPVSEPGKPGNYLSLFGAIGRLRPGVTPSQATSEGTARAGSTPTRGPVAMAVFGSNGAPEVTAVPMLQALTADVRPAIVVMLVAVGLLLLTATANVASLQLARATARRREFAIRSALGAGSGRLLRQSLMENLLLGLAGGAVALLLAAWCYRLLPTMLPADFPRRSDLAFDTRVQGLAILLSIATGLLAGLLPAFEAGRRNVIPALVEDSLAPVGGSVRTKVARVRALIMASQVAIACVLLVSALLLVRSFVALLHAPVGYERANLIAARVDLPDSDYSAARRLQALEQIAARLRGSPGVVSVGYSSVLPFTSGIALSSFPLTRRDGTQQLIQTGAREVSPGYFAALGQRIVEGREFVAEDSAAGQPAAIINREFARKYLDGNALNWTIPGEERKPPRRIVGVVEDAVRQSVTDSPQPELYLAALQEPPQSSTVNIVVRTSADPRAIVSLVRASVREAASAAPIESIQTMEDLISGSLARPRLYAVMLVTFAGFALAIAAVGLFGVLSYSVAQRSREIGVRTALGAQTRDIIALVARQTVVIAGSGLFVGLIVAMWFSRTLEKFVYGITVHDPVSFAGVILLLFAAAMAASIVPARRAARVDPVRVLRA